MPTLIGIFLCGPLFGFLSSWVASKIIVKARLRLRRSPGYRVLWLPLWCVTEYLTLAWVSSAIFVISGLVELASKPGGGPGSEGVAAYIILFWAPIWIVCLSPGPFLLKKVLDNYPLSKPIRPDETEPPAYIPVLWLISLVLVLIGGVAVLLYPRPAAKLFMGWLFI
jgi:hypothetical protein